MKYIMLISNYRLLVLAAVFITAAVFPVLSQSQILRKVGEIRQDIEHCEADEERVFFFVNDGENEPRRFFVLPKSGLNNAASSTIELDLGDTESVRLFDGYLYVYREVEGSALVRFDVVDIHNPAEPRLVQQLDNSLPRRGSFRFLMMGERWFYHQLGSDARYYQRSPDGTIQPTATVQPFAGGPYAFRENDLFSTQDFNQIKWTRFSAESLEHVKTISLGFPEFLHNLPLCAPMITHILPFGDSIAVSTLFNCAETGRPWDGDPPQHWTSTSGSLVFVDGISSSTPQITYPDVNLNNSESFESIIDFVIYDDLLIELQSRNEIRIWKMNGGSFTLLDRFPVQIGFPGTYSKYFFVIDDYLIVNAFVHGIHIYDLTSLQSNARSWDIMK